MLFKLDINSYPGTYDAIISFIDDDYKNQKKTVKITVLKNSTSINARNMVKYFKNGTKLTVKLLDNNKKVIILVKGSEKINSMMNFCAQINKYYELIELGYSKEKADALLYEAYRTGVFRCA